MGQHRPGSPTCSMPSTWCPCASLYQGSLAAIPVQALAATAGAHLHQTPAPGAPPAPPLLQGWGWQCPCSSPGQSCAPDVHRWGGQRTRACRPAEQNRWALIVLHRRGEAVSAGHGNACRAAGSPDLGFGALRPATKLGWQCNPTTSFRCCHRRQGHCRSRHRLQPDRGPTKPGCSLQPT